MGGDGEQRLCSTPNTTKKRRKGEFVAKQQDGGLQMENYYGRWGGKRIQLKPPSRTLAEGGPDITGGGGGRGTPSDVRGDQIRKMRAPG